MRNGALRLVNHPKLNEMEKLSETELMSCIEELCNNKAEEFRLYGYNNVTGQQIWKYVSETGNYQRKWPPLHRLVNDILKLKSGQFIDWIMLQSVYKGD